MCLRVRVCVSVCVCLCVIHIVAGCYVRAIRLWQACDAQRMQPVASQATACMPYTAELRYPSAGLDGVLLVLLYPRVPVAANTTITLILERFSLLPALEREAKARAQKEEAGGGRGGADKGGKDVEEAITKQACILRSLCIVALYRKTC